MLVALVSWYVYVRSSQCWPSGRAHGWLVFSASFHPGSKLGGLPWVPSALLKHLFPRASALAVSVWGVNAWACCSQPFLQSQPDTRICAQRLRSCHGSPLLPSCSSQIIPACRSVSTWTLWTCPSQQGCSSFSKREKQCNRAWKIDDMLVWCSQMAIKAWAHSYPAGDLFSFCGYLSNANERKQFAPLALREGDREGAGEGEGHLHGAWWV